MFSLPLHPAHPQHAARSGSHRGPCGHCLHRPSGPSRASGRQGGHAELGARWGFQAQTLAQPGGGGRGSRSKKAQSCSRPQRAAPLAQPQPHQESGRRRTGPAEPPPQALSWNRLISYNGPMALCPPTPAQNPHQGQGRERVRGVSWQPPAKLPASGPPAAPETDSDEGSTPLPSRTRPPRAGAHRAHRTIGQVCSRLHPRRAGTPTPLPPGPASDGHTTVCTAQGLRKGTLRPWSEDMDNQPREQASSEPTEASPEHPGRARRPGASCRS